MRGLENVAIEVERFLRGRVVFGEKGETCFKFSRRSEAMLISTSLAVELYQMLTNPYSIPDEWISQATAYILSCQNKKSGFFLDPIFQSSDLTGTGHDEEYLVLQFTYFAILALSSRGVSPRHKLSALEDLSRKHALEEWLARVPWDRPWLASNKVMFMACLLLYMDCCNPGNRFRESIEFLFDWLDGQQDENSGFWGTQYGVSSFEAMAGTFHYLIPYYIAPREIRFTEKILDSTLEVVRSEGLFSLGCKGGACEELDAVDILAKLSFYTNYRSEDIRAVLREAVVSSLFARNLDGGFSYRINPFDIDLSNLPFSGRAILRLLREARGVVRNRWSYRATWFFSGWARMPFALHRSDLWSTFARVYTLLLAAETLGIGMEGLTFVRVPGFGWHFS